MIVDALENDTDLTVFLKWATELYEGDPNFSIPNLAKARESLLRSSFVGKQKAFLFRRGSQPQARVVARLCHGLADDSGTPLGMLGFFESVQDGDAAKHVLAAAIDWLHAQGVKMIVGPMDGDTWHRYRFNVGPFDQPAFLMEPYNKPYYAELWGRAGFEPLEHYYSKVTDAVIAATDLQESYEQATAGGYTLRPLRLSQFEQEISIIYQISTSIFADNFLYQEITLNDFLDLYRPARSLIDHELVLIAESPDGEPVGFVFSLVDYQRAVVAMRGKQGWWAKFQFLLHRHLADAVNIKSLGVLPGHRRTGVAGALMYQTYRTSVRKGFRSVNLCLIREGNPSGRLDGDVGTVMRRYVLYQFAG